MPIALLVALAGSLAIHAAALFGSDFVLPGQLAESPRLEAELRPLPSMPTARVEAARRAAQKPKSTRLSSERSEVQQPMPPSEPVVENEPEETSTAEVAVPAPALSVLPTEGVIRYAIFKESLGLQIGRAEHRWEFSGDGQLSPFRDDRNQRSGRLVQTGPS